MKRFRVLLFAAGLAASLGTSLLIRPRFEPFGAQIQRRPRALRSGPMRLGQEPAAPASAVSTFRGDSARRGDVFEVPGPIRAISSLWRQGPLNFDLHGAAKATPAVDATGVYVGSDTGHFRKYDHDGRLRWTFLVHTLERGIHATALVTDDTVYFGAYNGWFYALDKTTGRPRWTVALGKVIGSSALLWQNALYLTVETESDGFVAKLDPVTGRILWTSEYLGQQAHASVTVDEVNHLALVGSNASNVTAIDLAGGARRWTFRTARPNKGTGALHDGRYVFGSTDGFVYALDAATGALRWTARVGGRILGNVTVDPTRGLGFIGSATGLTAFDWSDGSVRWRRGFARPGNTRGMGGQTPVLVASARRRWLLAQCRPRRLCAMDPASGAIESSWPIAGVYSGSVTPYARRLYVAYVDQGLEAFELGF